MRKIRHLFPMIGLLGFVALLAASAPIRAAHWAEQQVHLVVEPIAEIRLAGGIESTIREVPIGDGEIVVPAGTVRFAYSTNASDAILIGLSDELPPGFEVRVALGQVQIGIAAAPFTLETRPQAALSGIMGTAARDILVTYEIVVRAEAAQVGTDVYDGTVTYTFVG